MKVKIEFMNGSEKIYDNIEKHYHSDQHLVLLQQNEKKIIIKEDNVLILEEIEQKHTEQKEVVGFWEEVNGLYTSLKMNPDIDYSDTLEDLVNQYEGFGLDNSSQHIHADIITNIHTILLEHEEKQKREKSYDEKLSNMFANEMPGILHDSYNRHKKIIIHIIENTLTKLEELDRYEELKFSWEIGNDGLSSIVVYLLNSQLDIIHNIDDIENLMEKNDNMPHQMNSFPTIPDWDFKTALKEANEKDKTPKLILED